MHKLVFEDMSAVYLSWINLEIHIDVGIDFKDLESAVLISSGYFDAAMSNIHTSDSNL